MGDQDTMVLCVKVQGKDYTMIHPDSVKSECRLCHAAIYVMPYNKDKNTVCLDCVKKSVGGLDNLNVGITDRDFKNAMDHIRKTEGRK